MDVCKGGTVPPGATSITFTNHHAEPCTITGCKVPGWPPNSPIIPAEQNGVPGRVTVELAARSAVPGKYPYLASCCPNANPVIIVQ
jgi:hypothetical protein